MDGMDAAIADAGVASRRNDGDDSTRGCLACSSAGGGLRIAVVGYERAITAEAGFRVGLSAGGRVCHVTSGELTERLTSKAFARQRPMCCFSSVALTAAMPRCCCTTLGHLAKARLNLPVVLAGNVAARDQVTRILRRAACTVTSADNVLPKIGVLDPRSARQRDPRSIHRPRDRWQTPVDSRRPRHVRPSRDPRRRARWRGAAR